MLNTDATTRKGEDARFITVAPVLDTQTSGRGNLESVAPTQLSPVPGLPGPRPTHLLENRELRRVAVRLEFVGRELTFGSTVLSFDWNDGGIKSDQPARQQEFVSVDGTQSDVRGKLPGRVLGYPATR